jgi:transcriptional regulator with XRE-family HTH domain
VESQEIGRQLRARRTAAGRTVASVAADAGLSVPYIANLENGRGNPTTAALARLAEALGLRLVLALEPGDQDPPAGGTHGAGAPGGGAPEVPASLVRLGRTPRFRRAVAAMADGLDTEAGELSARLVTALAAVGAALGRDLAEADWWRLLDALTLVAAHPAERPRARSEGGIGAAGAHRDG